MMDLLIPLFFVIFKVLVLGTGMFFAVKWHFDRGQQGRNEKTMAVVLKSVKVAGVFLGLAFLMLYLVFTLCSRMGLDLTMP
jgi:hypothetical protein